MRKTIDFYIGGFKKIPNNLILQTLIVIMSCVFSLESKAQDSQVVQVKAFSEDFNPFPNQSISINQGEFVGLNGKGIVFVNLKASDIPIQSIKLKDEKLEVASWNLSKGVLEVIIRKKNYIDKEIRVVDKTGVGIAGVQVQFRGNKLVIKNTDHRGMLTIPLALSEEIKGVDQFKISDCIIRDFRNEDTVVITVEKMEMKVEEPEPLPIDEQTSQKEQNDQVRLLLSQLDTITSIKIFYELTNKVPRDKIDENTQKILDQKLDELLSQISKDELSESNNVLNKISDTTVVEEDFDNLLQQARKENKNMSQNRFAVEEKIQLVRDKLNVGFENLSEDSKSNLLNEIEELENILQNTKTQFNENSKAYLALINELKRRFFDIQELENRLSESEKERLKEKRIYQQRLLLILGVALIFAFLIVLLFYFRSRLKKQKESLIEAHRLVKLTNENLENIVMERTFLLHKTFKELDTVLYRASHDLRSPLCSIAGLSDLMTRETKNSELNGLLIKTTTKMDKLLKKLSIVSLIHQPADFEEVDITSLSENVIASFDNTIKERAINFKVNIELETVVLSIPKLVEVILYHLLENAFFFCWINNENDGEVEFNIRKYEENLEITVSDNGIGIEDTIKDKIFDMFYVGNQYSQGNGLGLYIVQMSTELLNGDIKVINEKRGFTKFIVHLPIDGKGSNTLEFLSSLKS
ncbi:ATP-binding protein [Marivirga salinae]|uniref:histidine kinase n=1 Tax=Marivirga salinarum TaxID=3059078 RepID=A0AA51NCI4_9BACT|nr:ATP-binding protein [Marivirga sp. BDSF4-3]WMN11095.1 ATP-binding protein [Marivirga sp. BDSF4-3]